MTSFPRALIEALLRVLSPSSCSACGEPESVHPFCTTCGAPVPVAPSSIDGVPVLAGGLYAPPLSNAIRRFKFEGHPELARPLASLLVPSLEGLGVERTDAWVPVPLHRARLVERGFNQSALIARAFAASTDSTFAPRTLERRRETEQQARLGRAARGQNTLGAFALRRPVVGGRVVLVDDVITTGATVRACLAAFRAANVAVLAVVALAQAPGR